MSETQARPDRRATPGTPRWVKGLGIAIIVLVLLVVLDIPELMQPLQPRQQPRMLRARVFL